MSTVVPAGRQIIIPVQSDTVRVSATPQYRRVDLMTRATFALLAILTITATLLPYLLSSNEVTVWKGESPGGALMVCGGVVVALFGRNRAPISSNAIGRERRAICSNVQTAIPTDLTYINYLNNSATDAYCIARIANETSLQAWYDQGNQEFRYSVIGSNKTNSLKLLSPGISTQNHQIVSATYPNGNVMLFVVYQQNVNGYTFQLQADTFLLNNTGDLLNHGNLTYSGPGSPPFPGLVNVRVSASCDSRYSGGVSGLYVVSGAETSQKPSSWGFDSSGNSIVNSYFDSTSVSNAFISVSPDNEFIIWTGSSGGTIYGTSSSRTKTVLSSVTVSDLTCDTLSDGNCVIVYVDASTDKTNFIIVDDHLNLVVGPTLVDPCETSNQANPKVLARSNGDFIIGMAIEGDYQLNYGYRFNNEGSSVLGRLPFTDPIGGSQGPLSLNAFNGTNINAAWSSGLQNIVLKSYAVDSPPSISQPIPTQKAFAGHPYNLNINGTFSADNAQYGGEIKVVSVTGLPNGFTFDPMDMTISGFPNSTGNASFTISATDTFGRTTVETVELLIGLPPALVKTIDTLTTTVNSYFYFPVGNTFTDPQGGSLTYGMTGLASWMTFQNNVLVFTAPQAATGVYNLTLTATNTDGISTSTSFSVNVGVSTGNNQGVLVNNRIPNVVEQPAGTFNFTLPANTFTEAGHNITLQATNENGGALINGLTFDPSTGIFQGDLPVGSYGITVRGIDGVGGSNIQTFTFDVTDVPPQITNSIDNLNAQVGIPFNQPISIQDHYAFQVNSWAEVSDPWLKYDNSSFQLSGTPDHGNVGLTHVVFHLTNARGFSTNKTVTVTVSGSTTVLFAWTIIGYIVAGVTGAGVILGLVRNRKKIISLLTQAKNEGILPTIQQAASRHLSGGDALELESKTSVTVNSQVGSIQAQPLPGNYTIQIGERFNLELNLGKIPQFQGAFNIQVRGIMRIESEVQTNALPSWIKYKIEKERNVIKFYSGSTSDAQLGRHAVMVVGQHDRDGSVEELGYVFHVTVANHIVEHLQAGQDYEKKLFLDTIFPKYQEGDDITHKINLRKEGVSHLIPTSWLNLSFEPAENRIVLTGKAPLDQGEYEVVLMHSRTLTDIQHYLFNVSIKGSIESPL